MVAGFAARTRFADDSGSLRRAAARLTCRSVHGSQWRKPEVVQIADPSTGAMLPSSRSPPGRPAFRQEEDRTPCPMGRRAESPSGRCGVRHAAGFVTLYETDALVGAAAALKQNLSVAASIDRCAGSGCHARWMLTARRSLQRRSRRTEGVDVVSGAGEPQTARRPATLTAWKRTRRRGVPQRCVAVSLSEPCRSGDLHRVSSPKLVRGTRGSEVA